MASDAQKPTGDDEGSTDTEQRGQSVDEATAVGAAEQLISQGAVRATPGLPVRLAEAAILLIGGAIAMGETERLMTGALTSYGSSRSVNDVIGLAALSGGDTWRVWLDLPAELRRPVAGWLFFHALFDIALYLGYWMLLRRLVSPVPAARRALRVLLALEIIETALLWLGSGLLYSNGVPGLFREVLAVVAFAKWLTGAFLVLVVLLNAELRGAVARGVVRLFRAVWEQRLSLVVVIAVGVLTLVPGPHIWDQLPDVQRSLVDGDPGDVRHAVWAVIATVVVSLYLFVIGRLRSERVWTTRVGNPPDNRPRPPQDPPEWRWWFVPPLLVLATAAILTALPVDGELVDWPDVWVAVAVPLIILALSGLVVLYYKYKPPHWLRQLLLRFPISGLQRWLRTDRTVWQEPAVDASDAGQRRRALDVWVAGDVLAVSVVVIAGLGLVRSLIAPLLLGAPDGGSGTWRLRVVVLVAGAVVAGGAFPLTDVWVRRLDQEKLPEDMRRAPVKRLLRPSDRRAGGRLRGVMALVLWLIAIAALVALMVFPLQFTRWLGVIATTLVALGAWAAVLGLLIVHLQYRKPLPVFSALRMRTTPVLTLLLVAPLFASQAGGDPDLHALSAPPGGAPAAVPDRPSLSEAFDDWLARSQGCDRPVGGQGGDNVRPMVLIAASGGGIRAAFWTAQVLKWLNATGTCGSQAVFLSSGISGGSVGLALSRGEDPTGDVEELAKPDALAAGTAGVLVGDLIAGTTGLRIPSLALTENGKEPAGRERWDWRDRAGLMEAVWESQAGTLTARYNQTLSGPAGVLVLNSAAAGRGCRVLVSQVELVTGPQERTGTVDDSQGTSPGSCEGQTNQSAASLDLQDTYGHCTPDMSWATAAMLSARFPWILPGGRVPPVTRTLPSGTEVSCRGLPDLQMIDGGYAEGSGIGTLADIAPALLQVVRDHNATPSSTEPYVVPVVLYLEDETRKDIVRQPKGLSPELFVPLAGRNAGAVQISSGTWLQRAATNIADPCPPADRRRCLAAVDAVQGKLSGGIVIAAPLTKPSVEPPLGWTLSEDSRIRLEMAAEIQATNCRPVLGYPCLKQLLKVLKGDSA